MDAAAEWPRPPRRCTRLCPRTRPLLGLLAASAAPLQANALGDVAFARDWDELRVADVDPHRIGTFSAKEHSEGGLMDVARIYFFGRDWLRIDGSSTPEHFLSSGFEFSRLDYPHEWSATVRGSVPVVLRVGKACNCELQGISAYSKSDHTAWLRMQFHRCTGCESGAGRAAVVMHLKPDAAADSNLYRWMCAVSDHAACDPVRPASTEQVTVSSTTPAPVAPTAAPSTTNVACNFAGGVGVKTAETDLGPGRCVAGAAGSSATHTTPSEQGCEVLCESTYATVSAGYVDIADIKANKDEINSHDGVCKAFSYNAAEKQCIIHYAKVDRTTDGQKDWLCIADVHAVDFTAVVEHDARCTTLAPTTTTVTSTSTTSTSTSTTTRETALLSFAELFAAKAEGGRVYGEPGETHFPRQGLEATLLQMQSQCFRDIDYYLLDMPLPVNETSWSKVMQLVGDYGDSSAWSDTDLDDCPTSISVDRLPVDADFKGEAGSDELSEPQQFMLTSAFSVFLGLLGGALAMLAKSWIYADTVAPQDFRFQLVGAASLAAALTAPLIYGAGQLVSWFFFRLAVKKFAHGGDPDLFNAAPLLSDSTLACAFTASVATFVIWVWPTGTASDERAMKMWLNPNETHRGSPQAHTGVSQSTSRSAYSTTFRTR